jgi:23S rRNA (adenine2503-C2)-methyltransferase
MQAYGERFYRPGERKITLNFALAKDVPVAADDLIQFFDPEKFLIKITPLNPTYSAENNGLSSYIDAEAGPQPYEVVDQLEAAGYQVIVSIGETEENRIGSNCGQYVLKHVLAESKLGDGYLYKIEHFVE